MSDKPKMYKGEIKKILTNNRSIYTSYNNNNNINNNYNISNIRKKINDIFNSYDFIYRTKVNIVIDNTIITKKIIGIYDNNLVTIDNEQIPISIIKDIYK